MEFVLVLAVLGLIVIGGAAVATICACMLSSRTRGEEECNAGYADHDDNT